MSLMIIGFTILIILLIVSIVWLRKNAKRKERIKEIETRINNGEIIGNGKIRCKKTNGVTVCQSDWENPKRFLETGGVAGVYHVADNQDDDLLNPLNPLSPLSPVSPLNPINSDFDCSTDFGHDSYDCDCGCHDDFGGFDSCDCGCDSDFGGGFDSCDSSCDCGCDCGGSDW